MELSNFFLFSFVAFFATADAAECEDGWFQFKDELCIKSFDSFLPYEEAKSFCSSQGNDLSPSSLVMVKEDELQQLLANYTHDDFDNIWLGGKYDNASAEFKWEDGAPLTYTNWQDGYPTNVTDPEHCIELRPQNAHSFPKVDGKWADVVCQKRNMVMCQKTLSWSLQDAIDEIISMRKEIKELQTVALMVVPVGSIYIEYFDQPSPPSIWPTLGWKDISSTYAGLFFRTLGGQSESWGSTQSDCAPRIIEMSYAEGGVNEPWNPLLIPSNGYSEYGNAGKHVASGDAHYDAVRFFTEGCEVRPKNQAIRIWKRIA